MRIGTRSDPGDPFDVVIVGAGPGGEACAQRLASEGLRVAVIEQELVGGECAYWGCVPSKTLLRAPELRLEARRVQGLTEPELSWPEARRYRDYMIQGLDDSGKSEILEEQGITIVRGAGHFVAPGVVAVGDREIETERLVVATGSSAAIPPVDGLDELSYWTNREAYTFDEPPRDVIVLGGGPVGLETAQMLHRYGSGVTLVEAGERLLADEEPVAGDLIARQFSEEGIDLRLGVQAVSATACEGRQGLTLEGGNRLEAERIIVATGRAPRVEGIGLATLGIEPGDTGAIEVDSRCRAGEDVWAVGDVTGVAPFTHVAQYQGRIAADDILGRPAHADYGAIPRVVFTDPEVAAVGLTTAKAQDQGLDVVEASTELGVVARSEMFGVGVGGTVTLVVDRDRKIVLGASVVGPLASEWIHIAVMAVKLETPLSVLRDIPFQFPTFSEAFGYALRDLPF